MSTIDEFLRQLQERAKQPLIASYATEADVRQAEVAMSARLPSSYKTLVTSCHPQEMPHWIYWLGPKLPPGFDLIGINKSEPIPGFLIAVCDDGAGDLFCFDTRRPDPLGEYPIVRWKHEIHDEHTSDFDQVAPDLGTFLQELL